MTERNPPLPPEELAEVLAAAQPAFEALRGARIFVTGGTGFFGHWLVESLLHADRKLSLDVRITLLTRSAETFQARSPHVAQHAAVTLLEGDITSFAAPGGTYTHIVHAATDAVSADAPAYALPEAIVDGTRHVLRFALRAGVTRLLYVSSGAVYGRNITDVAQIAETYRGGPDPLSPVSGYDEAKRMAENLCVSYAQKTSLECTVARAFAFVGPHLPLDAHFAIGNFIRDALRGEPIRIGGDGTPRRSFLYASDLAGWLWTVLARGKRDRAYNIGSDEEVSIAELAHTVAQQLPSCGSVVPVTVARESQAGAASASYVPDIERARSELGLHVTVPLAAAILRTARWHGYPRPGEA